MAMLETGNPKHALGGKEEIGSGLKSPIGSDGGLTTKKISERGSEMYAETKQVVSDVYDKTTDALDGAYKRVLVYGRQNPGTTMLVAFGAGAGVGLLLAAGGRRLMRKSYYGEAAVNAVTQVVSDLFRRR
jgi:ABC-type Fe3+-hydroxamate transport system substrate-binding protein